MKALVLSDIHGIQFKLEELLIRTKPDIIIIPGDLPTSLDFPILAYSLFKSRSRGEYVRQLYQRFKERIAFRQIRTAKRLLDQMNHLKIPVLIIHGNNDTVETRNWMELYAERYNNIHWISDNAVMINKILFIGHGWVGVPEDYNRVLTPGDISEIEDYRKLRFTIQRAKIEFPEYQDIVLVSHAGPYNTSLDYLSGKNIHVGSRAVRSVLDDSEVNKVICGHIHEAAGLYQEKYWWALNAGAVVEDKACLIDIDSGELYWYKNIVKSKGLTYFIYNFRRIIDGYR